MDWNIRFEPGGEYLTITAMGPIDVEGVREYLEAILADAAWRPGMLVLADFRDMSTDHLSVAQVRKIVEVHQPYMERIGLSPVAVVVSRPVDFGMVRMWEAMAAQMFPMHEVFYTTDEALAWLRSHRAQR